MIELVLVLKEIVVKNVNGAKGEKKKFVQILQIKELMVNIGEDILLLFNIQQNSFSTYLKNLTLKEVLHFFVQG